MRHSPLAIAIVALSMIVAGCRDKRACTVWSHSGAEDSPSLYWQECSDGFERRIFCTKTNDASECTCIKEDMKGRAGMTRGPTFRTTEASKASRDRRAATQFANASCGWEITP